MAEQEASLFAACKRLEGKGARLSLLLFEPKRWHQYEPALFDTVQLPIPGKDHAYDEWYLSFLCRDEFGFSPDPRDVRHVAGFG